MENLEKSNIKISVDGIVMDEASTGLTPSRHSEEVHEIITEVPSWILRWGTLVFLGILLLLIAISALVHYPDTITTALKVESTHASKTIVNERAGTLFKILVRRGEQVKKGQQLAYVKHLKATDNYSVLTAPQDGKVAFIAIIQEGCAVKENEEVFSVTAGNGAFFGVIEISSDKREKIREGQNVMVKLYNYPTEKFGPLKGKISFIADEPKKNGLFSVKVDFSHTPGTKKPFKLETWMAGTAEVLTDDVSLQSRIMHSIFKTLN